MHLEIPGHRLGKILNPLNPAARDTQRLIYHSELAGAPSVTRVMVKELPMELAAMVRAFVMSDGDGIGLPAEVQEILGGYRIRTGMGDFDGFPVVLDAGLASRGTGSLSGLPYVTTRWVTGRTLEQLSGISVDEGHSVLLALLEMLERLHRHKVVYGDLKPGNVVTDDGGKVHLVDLDTLRKVPEDDDPTICTHLTESWSAPEQKDVTPLLYLASDIYAYGLVAGFLLTGSRPGDRDPAAGLAGPWRSAVEACLRALPLDRPNAAALLAYLTSGGGELDRWNGEPYSVPKDETVRVEDPPEPVVIPGVVADKPRPVTIDWPALRRWLTERSKPLTRSRWPGLAAALVLVGLLIGWGAQAMSRRSEANSQAQALWEDLEAFKTVRTKHTEKELAGIARRCDALTAGTRTGFALGVRALAKVWDQKWTYSARRVGWSESRFNEGMQYVEEALAKKRTPEALLALGLLHSGACRKMSDEQAVERNEHCRESSKVLDEAARRNGTDRARDWLAVEIQWTAVMSESSLGSHLIHFFDDDDGAREVYRQAFERCQQVWPRLPGAPINNRELAQDCLVVAGQAREFAEYLEWSDWLIEYDRRTRDEVRASTKAHIIVSVDLECRERVKFSRGLPRSDPDAEGDVTDLCRFFGYVALGCPDKAKSFLGGLRQRGVLWDLAEAAARSPARTKCAI